MTLDQLQFDHSRPAAELLHQQEKIESAVEWSMQQTGHAGQAACNTSGNSRYQFLLSLTCGTGYSLVHKALFGT